MVHLKLPPKEVLVTDMNELEKRSFYSFLGLYIVSSLIFLSGIAYWYYIAQKKALSNETYYKLQHIADIKSGDIIMAHMKGIKLKVFDVPKGIVLALIDTKGKIVEGELMTSTIPIKEGYYYSRNYNIFISNAPKEHLNIAYVVAQSSTLQSELAQLKKDVLKVLVVSIFLIIIIAWLLSKLFMKPVRERVEQVERFINDITHELNTPITALLMTTNQALKQEHYTKKTLNNISISTKQLYDIYTSLTYLNFSSKKEVTKEINISEVLQKSIEYYEPLCQIKRISIEVAIEPYFFAIPKDQLQLLYGNLIGNAIKYSWANSTMYISLKEGIFSIKDEGIGIEPTKQKAIFEKFKRGTEYAGGFGIGLNIVKSICDEYGIAIKLDSIPNKGTEFRLFFH